MAKTKKREEAIALREKEQMSYSQIKKALKVSKSTLSLWLRDYPLSQERIKSLQKNEAVIEKIRNTKKQKREKRLKDIYEIQKKEILPLSNRELFIAGLLLYWGEGTKNPQNSPSISNSDPSVINFFMQWLDESLNIPKEKIKIYLHLYNDMDINKELKYWSEELKVPLNQFRRPYIKKTSSNRINHKGGFGHGTCNLIFGNVSLAEKILMSIKAISEQYQ